jgi:hypothetical protein
VRKSIVSPLGRLVAALAMGGGAIRWHCTSARFRTHPCEVN